MDQTITIPDDIIDAVALLAALEASTSNQYLERYWLDIRWAVQARGGIAAIQAEIDALTAQSAANEQAEK